MSSVLDAIKNVVGVVTGLTDTASGVYGNVLSQKQWQEAMEYNKYVQETNWKREDTAVQRRAEDLQAAGMNPLLAVGSAATTQQTSQAPAPSARYQALNSSGVLNNFLMAAQMKNIESQANYNDALADRVREETDDLHNKNSTDYWVSVVNQLNSQRDLNSATADTKRVDLALSWQQFFADLPAAQKALSDQQILESQSRVQLNTEQIAKIRAEVISETWRALLYQRQSESEYWNMLSLQAKTDLTRAEEELARARTDLERARITEQYLDNVIKQGDLNVLNVLGLHSGQISDRSWLQTLFASFISDSVSRQDARGSTR